MTILETTGDYVGPNGEVYAGARVLTGAEEVEHRLYARAAALQAATRLAPHPRWSHRAPLELAEAFEDWLLRPVGPARPDGPVAMVDHEPPPGS